LKQHFFLKSGVLIVRAWLFWAVAASTPLGVGVAAVVVVVVASTAPVAGGMVAMMMEKGSNGSGALCVETQTRISDGLKSALSVKVEQNTEVDWKVSRDLSWGQ
jgi:hypothetical protein